METQPTAMPDMPSASPSGDGGGNIEDRMQSVFAAALSQDSEPSQADSREHAAEPAVGTTEAEPSVEKDADATAQEPVETASEETDPYADLDEPGDQGSIEKFLTTPRGREIYQNHKLVEQLAKPTTQGGIGHVPSVQDMRTYFAAHRDSVAMGADFTSGDPARVGRFLSHWFGPDQNGRPRASSLAVLQHLEPALAQFGSDIYGQVASPVMSRYEASLIEKWRGAQDPSLKQALYQAAQVVHHDLTNEWLPEEAFHGKTAARGQSTTHPDQERLAAGWQQLNAERQATRREAVGRWDQSFNAAESSTLNSEIDKALKPLQEMRSKTPELYESLKERMAKQVRNALEADPEIWGLYQQKVDDARRTGNPAAVERVMKDYLALAIPAIRDKRATFLKGAGVVIMKQSTDRHAQLRSVASNVAPTNNGAPAKRSAAPSSGPRPGESKDDYRERRFSEALAI